MNKLRLLCLLSVATALLAQAPAPPSESSSQPPSLSQEDQDKIIAGMRKAALSYETTLPEFACGRVTRREIRLLPDDSPPANDADPDSKTTVIRLGAWQSLDLTEGKLVWSDNKETDTIIRVNGKRAVPGLQFPKSDDAHGSGVSAFTGILQDIFSESAHAEWKWKESTSRRGLSIYVFEYHVAGENSKRELTAGGVRLTPGFHGLVYADKVTSRILSVTFEADVPVTFPLQDVKGTWEFGETIIGQRFQLMPLQNRWEERGAVDLLKHDPDTPKHDKAAGKGSLATSQMTTEFQACHKYVPDPPAKPE